MTYRQLGDSGLTVSTVGLGCNNFGRRLDQEGTTAVVSAAIDAGVTLFDTADIYGLGASEELLGAALGKQRENVVVATKFGMDMQGANGPDWGVRGSRRYIRTAVEASLRRLGTDWIDLYQLHRPDPQTPIGETLAALDELVREGKVRYIGSSNLTGWQVVDADWTARSAGTERFVSAQNEYSLLERDVEEELVPACEHVGVGLLPFFPLASGLLTGKYRRGEPAPEGTPPRVDGRAARGVPTGTPSSASRGMPPSAVYAPSTSPSAGSRPSPPWPRSSPARPRPSRCVDNVRAGLVGADRVRPRRPRRDHPATLTPPRVEPQPQGSLVTTRLLESVGCGVGRD